MNWREGLHRVSAIIWGLLGLLVLIAALGTGLSLDAAPLLQQAAYVAVFFAIGGAICYAGHKATCWVVNGFFRQP